MANPNPQKARQAKKSYRKPGDLKALQHKLWGAILHAEEVLESASSDRDRELTLKAIHAISQCCGQYAKLLEIGELEARVATLESQVQGRTAA